MEVGEQQEDAGATAGATIGEATAGMEQKQAEVEAMESGEEQRVEAGEQQQEQPEEISFTEEKEDAVMESLPVEVESDKLRSEREKAPDNAEERSVHEDTAGGLGFRGEKESREVVVGLDCAGDQNGTVHAEGEADGQALEDGDAEGAAIEEIENAAVAPIDEGEFAVATVVEVVETDAAIGEGEATVEMEVETVNAAAASDEAVVETEVETENAVAASGEGDAVVDTELEIVDAAAEVDEGDAGADTELEMVDATAVVDEGETVVETELETLDAAARIDEGRASVEKELKMVDVAVALDEGEPETEGPGPAGERRTGVEKNGTKIVQASMKRNASAALENADGIMGEVVVKRPKKKANVWSKSTTRKTSRKSKPVKIPIGEKKEECIEVNPAQRYSLEERNGIQLSKDQKAEKVELSLDKMQASSEKGYRMVRATRGVTEGAWYFEIKVKDLGATGHTRLGWSTWKGDLQAPVGFDANSYAFRDVDGSKVHQAIREPFGAPYHEGDVIGFYISLPNGAKYAPKYELYVTKAAGTRQFYPVPVEKEEGPLKRVPGSEISFFKNGVCQGVAYTEIYAGEYFPAASMYTLPSPEKKCSVRFNFGPNFQFPVEDWGDRPVPLPMSQALPPEGLAAADAEEPVPSDTPNKSDTPKNAGGKQRMAAERGNGTVEGHGAVGSGVRTKRATDDKDRGKRSGLPGKKLSLPKASKKMITLPRANQVAKSPVSDASLHIEVNLEGCSNEGSGNFGVRPPVHDQGNSSDTQTD